MNDGTEGSRWVMVEDTRVFLLVWWIVLQEICGQRDLFSTINMFCLTLAFIPSILFLFHIPHLTTLSQSALYHSGRMSQKGKLSKQILPCPALTCENATGKVNHCAFLSYTLLYWGSRFMCLRVQYFLELWCSAISWHYLKAPSVILLFWHSAL